MRYTTHNDEFPAINIDGTSLQGYIEANYLELIGLFGQPTEGDRYKTDAEWYIMFDNGQVATIYNWKNGVSYLGDDGLPVSQITDWHIGGKHSSVVDLVTRVVLEGRGALA